MEKPLVCFDISEGTAKIVIGYNVGGKPIVAYSDARDVSSYIRDGQIVDKEGLIAALSSMKEINDPATHLSVSVTSGICLIAPATGLTIYEMTETTNVVSPENEVAKIDISNLHSKIRKNELPDGYKIVDIIPDFFILSNGERYGNPPVGKTSSSLTVSAKIHCLPESVYAPVSRAISETGLRVLRLSVSPFCQAEYFKTYPELPKSYLLVDIGYHLTSVSLIGEGTPYGSVSFYLGGNDLTEVLAEKFGIMPDLAERLKIEYGYDTRPCSYQANLYAGLDQEGNHVAINQKQFNAAIEEFGEDYLRQLGNAIATLLKDYNGIHESLPMILTGGGSGLYGIDQIIGEFFPKRDRYYPEIRTIGARERGFAGALGMILVASRYSGSMVDDYKGVGPLSRPAKPNSKEKRQNASVEIDAL